jgi:hypothetical protein
VPSALILPALSSAALKPLSQVCVVATGRYGPRAKGRACSHYLSPAGARSISYASDPGRNENG